MSPKVAYIQKYQGEFASPCAYSAWEGLRFLGYDCRFFEEDQLSSLPLTKDTLVVGWVRVVLKALDQLGVSRPEPLDYPESLQAWFGRNIRLSTLGAVRESVSGAHTERPFFLKPVEHKLFTGHLLERYSHFAETEDFPATTMVWVSEPVDFVSEWRCFVSGGRLVGIKHYLGDPWVLPDKKSVIQMKYDFEQAPSAYALDVGITEDGRTLLVEVNDAFALGNYALSSLTYSEMLIDRWQELVRLPSTSESTHGRQRS